MECGEREGGPEVGAHHFEGVREDAGVRGGRFEADVETLGWGVRLSVQCWFRFISSSLSVTVCMYDLTEMNRKIVSGSWVWERTGEKVKVWSMLVSEQVILYCTV